MALPALPVRGQNPWYDTRTNWDNSVEDELEGRLSLSALDATYAPLAEGVKTLTGKLADDAPSTYPRGISNHSTSGGSWPAALSTVTTSRVGGTRTMQTVIQKVTGEVFFRAEGDGDVWGPWSSPVKKDSQVINVLDYGVTGNGVTRDSLAIKAVIDAAPPGSTILFPGGKTYLMYDAIAFSGKSINIKAVGAKFLYERSEAQIRFEGGFDAPISVTSMAAEVVNPDSHMLSVVRTNLGAAVPTSWRRGDIIRVFADDIIPGSRDAGDTSILTQGRVGQYLQVLSYSGSEVLLTGVLDDFSSYSTDIKVARLKTEVRFSWEGGDFDYTDAAMAQTGPGSDGTLDLAALYRPDVRGIEIRRFNRTAVRVVDCYAWKVQGDFGFGPNILERYGYGVGCYASSYGTLYNSRFGQVRHGFLDGHMFIPTGTGLPRLHGRPHDNSVVNCTVESSTNAAFDTHTSGLRERFIGCYADNARAGFSFRGKNHFMEGCVVTNSVTAVSMIQENSAGISEGHQVNDLRCENVGSIFVSNLGGVVGSAMYQTLVTNPTMINGVRARNVTGREFDITYNSVFMNDWQVLRAATGLPGRVAKAVLDITDYHVNMLAVTTPGPFLEMSSVVGGGDRNKVRLRDIYIENTVSNLTWIVASNVVGDGRVSSSRIEADFIPVSGGMQYAYEKISRRVYLADYV